MRWFLGLFTLILLLTCGYAKVAFAASVMPATIDLSGARGETLEEKVTIINTENSDQTFYFETIKFTAQDESGMPKFLQNEKTDLSRWIFLPVKTMVVPARSSADVSFKISIPSDIAAGSYFAALTISDSPSDVVADNGATLQAKTAVLVFLTVEGETTLAAGLLDFKSSFGKFTDRLSGTFAYRIQNQGNVYFVPVGSVIIQDAFGRNLITTDANEEKGRVLPDTTRAFSGPIGQEPKNFLGLIQHQISNFTVGPLSLQLTAAAGADGPTINATETVWYVPWQTLLFGVLIIVFVLLVRYKLKKKMS